MKGNKRYFTDLFLENGNINVTLGKESKVSGTPNNDAYQKFKDGFMALSKEMNEMYQKAQSDTSLTEEQVEAIMAEIEKKDSVGMDMFIKQLKPISPIRSVYICFLPMQAHSNLTNKKRW